MKAPKLRILGSCALFAVIACGVSGCDVKVNNPPGNTTVVNPPAEKKVENNTTIVNPPKEETTKQTTTTVETK